MKNIVKSYVRIHNHEFIYEFMPLNSWLWNHIWIHNHELMCEFSAMKNKVDHAWIPRNEFTHEIMARHCWIHYLKIIQDSASNWFQWGKMSYSSKVIIDPQLTASPKAVAWLLLSPGHCGNQAALLRRQTSGAAHSRAGRTWRAFSASHDGRHLRPGHCLLGLLVSNEGNFRNLQVERLSKGSTSRT